MAMVCGQCLVPHATAIPRFSMMLAAIAHLRFALVGLYKQSPAQFGRGFSHRIERAADLSPAFGYLGAPHSLVGRNQPVML